MQCNKGGNTGAQEAVRLAYAALQAGRYAEARDVAAAWPKDASCRLLHALARAGAGDVRGGAAALAAIARANPAAQHPAIDLADLLRRHGADPVPHLRAALAQMPGHAILQSALAGALVETGPMDEAAALFQDVARMQPGNGGAWSNAGKALAALGRFAEAAAAFDRAVALLPDHAQIRLNQAVATLKAGRLTQGWPLFKARHDLPGRPAPPGGAELTSLDGVAGKTVLLLHNEGFGDTLQFIRYAPLLAKLGAQPIALVPPTLRRLLHGSGIALSGSVVPAYDAWCHISDLPGVFGTTVETIPAAIPYLRADPAAVALWAGRLPPRLPGTRRAGLVWAGEARLHDAGAAAADRQRSIRVGQLAPLLEGPLLKADKVQWINLQHGTVPPPGVFDPMPDVADFADTAAIIANLDLVVSVDTAPAHLAAALGTPVLLLDRYDNCWRWLHGRTDSPWYPGVLRIIRQETPGDWERVLTQAASLASV